MNSSNLQTIEMIQILKKVQMNLKCALNFKTPWRDKNLIEIIECWTAEF